MIQRINTLQLGLCWYNKGRLLYNLFIFISSELVSLRSFVSKRLNPYSEQLDNSKDYLWLSEHVFSNSILFSQLTAKSRTTVLLDYCVKLKY